MAGGLDSLVQSDNIKYVSIVLKWSGVKQCSQNTSCSDGLTFFQDYACSMPGYGNWNNGLQTFLDPIPPGNTLVSINITLYGRFYCNTDESQVNFLATIDDGLVACGWLPFNPSGCNCSNCMTQASYPSESMYNDYLTYKYQQLNLFQMQPLINGICLSAVNITFFYNPVDLTVLKVSPDSGPLTGTSVNITITGSNNTNWCQFGEDGSIVSAHLIGPDIIYCAAPPVPSPRTVVVRLSIDGLYFFNSTVSFTYYDSPPVTPLSAIALLKNYWWVLLIGALVIIGVVSVFGITFRSRKYDPATQPLLHSGSINISDSEQQSSIGPGDIVLGERIGRGNFGEVYKGYWHGTVVAVKKMKLPSVATKEELQEFFDDFDREAQIMRNIRHPNILQFLGICKVGGDKGEICIITEFMPKGSLHRILHDSSVQLDWPLRLRMAVDVSRGMNYLHKSNPIIIHRDLKSHNLLLDDYFKVKICDFGLAKLVNSNAQSSSMTSCGTPAWTAPEVLRNERYTESADVFSFGIVLWELVTREEPHHGVPPFQVVFAVGTQGIRPMIPSSCPVDISTLIEECWAESPDERPDFTEIMKRIESIESSIAQDFSK